DLLVDDESNPRSLAFQLTQLDALLDGLAGSTAAGVSAERAAVQAARAELHAGVPVPPPRALDRAGDESLARIQLLLSQAGEAIAAAYFGRSGRPQQLVRLA